MTFANDARVRSGHNIPSAWSEQSQHWTGMNHQHSPHTFRRHHHQQPFALQQGTRDQQWEEAYGLRDTNGQHYKVVQILTCVKEQEMQEIGILIFVMAQNRMGPGVYHLNLLLGIQDDTWSTIHHQSLQHEPRVDL